MASSGGCPSHWTSTCGVQVESVCIVLLSRIVAGLMIEWWSGGRDIGEAGFRLCKLLVKRHGILGGFK